MNPEEFSHIVQSEREFWWYRGMRHILERVLDPLAASRHIERVLEGGCGTGFQSLELSRRYKWNMVPLDYSYVGLTHARRYGLDRLVQGDLGSLPFSAAVFDAVVSLDVIVHFPLGSEGAAFQEMARVLTPGGLLVVRVSALDSLRSRHSIHAEERQRFTRDRLRKAAVQAGFSIQRCTYLNSLLLPAAWFKFRVWEPLTNAAPASGVDLPAPWLNRLLELPLRAEAAWLARGGGFPLGQSLLLVAAKPGSH